MRKLSHLCLISAFQLFSLSAFSAHLPPLGTWNVYNWQKAGYIPSNADGVGELAVFAFPTYGARIPIPAFITTVSNTALLGDLTGTVLTATLTISVNSGNPEFVGTGWNTWNSNGLPSNTRLYISTSSANYDLDAAAANPSNYWWSRDAWTIISSQTGTVTLTDTFDPSHWSNANGIMASDPSVAAAFQYAISHVAQTGLAFGYGSYFDVGCAIKPNTGSASFHLSGYTAN